MCLRASLKCGMNSGVPCHSRRITACTIPFLRVPCRPPWITLPRPFPEVKVHQCSDNRPPKVCLRSSQDFLFQAKPKQTTPTVQRPQRSSRSLPGEADTVPGDFSVFPTNRSRRFKPFNSLTDLIFDVHHLSAGYDINVCWSAYHIPSSVGLK